MSNDSAQGTWTLRTKVDKVTHDDVIEVANHLTGGNISALLRKMIGEWLVTYHKEIKAGGLSIEMRAAWYERRQQQRVTTKDRLNRIYLGLLTNPDPEGEAIGRELAEKYELAWPPYDVKLSQVDPDLDYIMRRLNSLWREMEGRISLQTLNRSLSKYSAIELREHLSHLEKLGDVVLKGSRIDYTSLEIVKPDLQ